MVTGKMLVSSPLLLRYLLYIAVHFSNCQEIFSALTLLVGRRKGIRPVKN